MSTDVFYNVDKQNCKLYVPQGSEEAYRESELWKDFNIIEMGTGIASPFEEAGEHGSVYDLQGRRMVNAPCSMS